MKRRTFIAALGGAVASPLAARALQAQGKLWRIGYLTPGQPPTNATRHIFKSFVRKLADLGYVEGQNLILDVRRADGDNTRLPVLAAELVSRGPDAIVAVANPAVAAVAQATTSIPIVMSPSTDPVVLAFVKSLAKPGGNITGVANMYLDVTAKLAELLRAASPNSKRIGVLMSATPGHEIQLTELQSVAPTLHATIVPVRSRPDAWDNAFALMQQQGCDAVIVFEDATISLRVVDLAALAKLPAIYQVGEYAGMGGLMSYSPNFSEMFRQAAVYVDEFSKAQIPPNYRSNSRRNLSSAST